MTAAAPQRGNLQDGVSRSRKHTHLWGHSAVLSRASEGSAARRSSGISSGNSSAMSIRPTSGLMSLSPTGRLDALREKKTQWRRAKGFLRRATAPRGMTRQRHHLAFDGKRDSLNGIGITISLSTVLPCY
ncbi:hypothetical protein EAI_13064 [Harpegnathos saltator]|uniref:Uncharacterized protein n=1 Tax=Harpegnathos saltator TaxID=610380 RepID=E2BZF9_HARSA|nr:hypothetical protein EAI_13064 [Harpegnathos saltator]